MSGPRRVCGRAGHDLTAADSTITLYGYRRCRLCYEAQHPSKPKRPVLCPHDRVLSECRICYLDARRAARAAPELMPAEDALVDIS